MNDKPKPEANDAVDQGRAWLGAAGEELAVEHLLRRGFAIVERNFRTRWGELDIIAVKGRTIVFCEVKTRVVRGAPGGAAPGSRDPLESVHARKQAKVRRMAARWLIERRDRPHADELRFDAIGIAVDGAGQLLRLDHLEGAF
jgi:putative endonuclease